MKEEIERKASELVDHFYHNVPFMVFDEKERAWRSAIQSALFTAQQVITALENCLGDQTYLINYWQAVKEVLQTW